MARADLLSITSRVEVPYVVAELGGLTLGKFVSERVNTSDAYSHQMVNVTYPNFIKGLTVVKNASGLVNNYTLDIVYAVREDEDPNLIEKLLSKAKKNRKILFSYGDSNTPNFIFRSEEALITKVTSSVDLSNAVISYKIQAVSNSYKATSTKRDWPKRVIKGSKLIKELLFSTEYQLNQLFYGMKTLSQVEREAFIADDDVAVTLEAKAGLNVLDYLKYIVSCMRWQGDVVSSGKKQSIYKIAAFDDISSTYGGPYFKVIRYASSTEVVDSDDLDYMTVNVGYPDRNAVVTFNVDNDESFALLYDYEDELAQSKVQHSIGDDGKITSNITNRVVMSTRLRKETEANKTWWAQMTSYPLTATMNIRGLLRNVELMSQIRLNVLFYGRKHIYSGIYSIIGQTDTVNSEGFRTTLRLLRVGGSQV